MCTSSRHRRAVEVSKQCLAGQGGERSEANLLDFAFPTLLSLVRPSPGKCGLARLEHERLAGIFFPVVSDVGLDGGNDSPAAMRRMLQMLKKRVIARLPAIESLVAEETDDIVGAAGKGAEIEARTRQLRRGSRQVSNKAARGEKGAGGVR